MIWDNYYQLTRWAGKETEHHHSIFDLIEGEPVQSFDSFQKWKSFEFWKNIIATIILNSNWQWFDIVLFNSLNQEFEFRAIYSQNLDDSNKKLFNKVQELAKDKFYRNSVTSFSSIFVEGHHVLAHQRYPIWLTRYTRDEYNSTIASKIQSPFVRIALVSNDINFPTKKSEIDSFWSSSAKAISETDWFQQILKTFTEYLDIKDIEPLKFAGYFVWLLGLPRWKHYIYLPLPNLYSKTGAFVVTFNGGIDENEILTRFEYSMPRFSILSNVISAKADKVVGLYAIRSAIAVIISRNMSHNIGSHAIWHLVQEFKNDIYGKDDIKLFLLYLQKRMDFIAQVSTSSPSWCLTIKWRYIVDELLNQNCLLDNIVWSHQVRYCEFWFNEYSQLELDQRPGKSLSILMSSNSECNVDIPHGLIGLQSFYIILENLIRNAAKYGDWKTVVDVNSIKPFIITIKIEEWNEEYYQISIKDNIISNEETISKLNNALKEPIIDKMGNLKPGDWGVKEIKICSAYLRMVKQEFIDSKFIEWQSDANVPPMVKVRLTNNNWEEVQAVGNLTYIFYILRPKDVLYVG